MGGYAEKLFPAATPSGLATSVILGVLTLFWIIITREATPLRRIPGPFLASITKLWIVQKQRGYKRPLVDIELHKKYGRIIRIAPNEVSISSPQAFRTIYGTKGDWYIGTSTCGWNGADNLDFLSEGNMEKYRTQRRAVGPAYAEAAMKDLEPQIDAILEKNVNNMRERAGQSVDLDLFFNMFASDCYSMVSFSKSKNLVEDNKVDSLVLAVHAAWKYMHIVGYFPLVHRTLTAITHISARQSTWLKHLIDTVFPFMNRDRTGKQSKENPFAFPIEQIQSRFAARKKSPLDHKAQEYPKDIAGKLFQLQDEKGVLKDHWVRNMVMTNFGAGVETTAVVVAGLINNVVSHAGCQEKVHAELDKARKDGRIGKTTVGINPWVFCRDKTLYGDDAEEWRPERWLEYSPEKLKYLETYSVSFGTGARSCPGKYLAQAVYTKMIPMLFQDFEWSYTDPEAEKVLQCTFTVRQLNGPNDS
ncbi:hypothetical protein EG329_004693 [Mollisiaceae sp. DMI_Dod_QoI]|nr:hypothetical protein EG329_004693 [Helotiales sp. DMI_Dod_QoI]